MDIRDAIENTKQIYLSDSSLNILMDFERVLDELDLYAFENWIKGEIVDGPKVDKYWVTCRFMWPYKMMPNPRGGVRLLPFGCKISYEKTEIKVPVKIKTPDDFRDDGSKKGKLANVKVWLVSIRMPRSLISDIEQGSLEIAGENIDLEDIQQAYDEGLDQQSLTQQNDPNGQMGSMGMDGMGGMGDMGDMGADPMQQGPVV